MHKKPIYAAFASPKGGVGKTTLTIITASYLHYRKDYHVAVVDCNHPIYPIRFFRQQEVKEIDRTPRFKEKIIDHFYKSNIAAYPIVSATMQSALVVAQELERQDPKLDLIFFDMPNLMVVDQTSELLSKMDFVIFPTTGCFMTAMLTSSYVETLNEQVITTGKGNIKSLYLLRTMINGWQQNDDILNSNKLADRIGATFLKTSIPYTEHSRAHIFEEDGDIGISTLLPTDPCCHKLMAQELASEVHQIIKGLCGGK